MYFLRREMHGSNIGYTSKYVKNELDAEAGIKRIGSGEGHEGNDR